MGGTTGARKRARRLSKEIRRIHKGRTIQTKED